MSQRSIANDVLSTDTYTPDQVIKSRQTFNTESDRLNVIFQPWHGGGTAFDILHKRLVGHGQGVASFEFDGELLKPDVEQVLESFDYLQQEVSRQLGEITSGGHFKTVHLIGLSLGAFAMAKTAESFRDFDAATFVVGGSNLAQVVWNGIRTSHIRQQLEAQDPEWTMESLDEAWQPVAPINHVQAFKGKDVNALISMTDRIIPTESQLELADAFVAAGITINASYTSLGHYAAAGRFCLFDSLKS